MFARGVVSFCLAPLPASRQNSPKSNDSPTYAPISRKSNDSPTYAKTGGWGAFPAPTFKYHLKCRRADIVDFSLIFRAFSPPHRCIACIQHRGRRKRAGPVEASGAQTARMKDQRYISEGGMRRIGEDNGARRGRRPLHKRRTCAGADAGLESLLGVRTSNDLRYGNRGE
jgi:hypothetical protein